MNALCVMTGKCLTSDWTALSINVINPIKLPERHRRERESESERERDI